MAGCSFRIPDPDPDFLPIPDSGPRGQKGTVSPRIPDPDPQHFFMGARAVLWIRIHIRVDPHHFGTLDPHPPASKGNADPDPHKPFRVEKLIFCKI
jgi:hypothetical protein